MSSGGKASTRSRKPLMGIDALAEAAAQGATVTGWARDNGVPLPLAKSLWRGITDGLGWQAR